jgi:hypothetical protein
MTPSADATEKPAEWAAEGDAWVAPIKVVEVTLDWIGWMVGLNRFSRLRELDGAVGSKRRQRTSRLKA